MVQYISVLLTLLLHPQAVNLGLIAARTSCGSLSIGRTETSIKEPAC